jgi:two-component system response regulator
LLVEDNPSDEKLTLRAFRKADVPHDEVVVVRDGAEALDYLFGTGVYSGRDARNVPTMILLDLKLPRISGFDVLRRVRADPRTRLVPVVVLTTSTEEEDVSCCYHLGANAYVRKPVDFDEFAVAARTLSLFWLELNQTASVRGGVDP